MALADRFAGWLESLGEAWKDRLRGWMAAMIGLGMEAYADTVGRKLSAQLKPLLERMQAEGAVPPEAQPLVDEMLKPTGETAYGLANTMSAGMLGGTLGMLMEYLLRPIKAKLSAVKGFHWPNAELAIGLWRRGQVDRAELDLLGKGNGLSPDWIKALLIMSELRLPSEIIGEVWLRDPKKWDWLWGDLPQIGVDPTRAEALRELIYKVPGVQDIIRYVVKEAYNPEVYKAFGQDQEYPAVAEADALKTGVRPDHLFREWLAHWELPGISQGFEMLHRGKITPEELQLLLKARDVMPFWRSKLTAISYQPYNRIDARRMWDLGVLDDAALKRAYLDQGYDDEHATALTLWTKLFMRTPQLIARYRGGWINAEEVLAELVAIGLTPERAKWVWETKIRKEAPARTEKERELTKAEIVAAVRKGILAWEEAVPQLMALGYDALEADLILAIGVEVEEGLPTDELRTRVDTVRRMRRNGLLTRDQEIVALTGLGLEIGLATAYADNDDLRLTKAAQEGA